MSEIKAKRLLSFMICRTRSVHKCHIREQRAENGRLKAEVNEAQIQTLVYARHEDELTQQLADLRAEHKRLVEALKGLASHYAVLGQVQRNASLEVLIEQANAALEAAEKVRK